MKYTTLALAIAALALPTLAMAQDPSTRTDLTIVGAVSADKVEATIDANATPVAELPIVYEDETSTQAAASAEESAAASSANLGQSVQSE